jgi:hypothetical protein
MSGSLLGQPTFARCEVLGAATGTSGGVNISTGTTANTKTAYSVIGTTSFRWKAAYWAIGSQHSNARTVAGDMKFDVAIGAAGVEQIICADQYYLMVNSTQIQGLPRKHGLYPCDIPSGANVSMRAAGSTTTAVSMDYFAIGFG